MLNSLAGQLAQYKMIASMIGGTSRALFRLGSGARPWLPQTGEAIIKGLFPGVESLTPEEAASRAPRRHGYEQTPAGLWRRER